MAGLFHVFYTGSFGLLSFVFLLLTLVSPGDMIYQAYSNHRLGNIFVVAGVYTVTALACILIYASRILTTRQVLANIPKPWIPVEKPDVAQSVRKQIVTGLTRSAIIAQQAHPRDRSEEEDGALDKELVLPHDIPPPWGVIQHLGWTAPDCPDLPGCEFAPVIAELPYLIEAKAVSLAPTILYFSQEEGQHVSLPDERIVEVLKRHKGLSLRAYLDHLVGLDMADSELTSTFIRMYERAKFSSQPLSESEFRSLMQVFSALLRNMAPLSIPMLAEIRDMYDGDDDDDDGTSSYISNSFYSSTSLGDVSGRRRPRRLPSSSNYSYSGSSIHTTSSVSQKDLATRARQVRRAYSSPSSSIYRLNRPETRSSVDVRSERSLGPHTAAHPSGRAQNQGRRYADTLHPDTARRPSASSRSLAERRPSYSSYTNSNSGDSSGSVVFRPATGDSSSLLPPATPISMAAMDVLERMETYASAEAHQ